MEYSEEGKKNLCYECENVESMIYKTKNKLYVLDQLDENFVSKNYFVNNYLLCDKNEDSNMETQIKYISKETLDENKTVGCYNALEKVGNKYKAKTNISLVHDCSEYSEQGKQIGICYNSQKMEAICGGNYKYYNYSNNCSSGLSRKKGENKSNTNLSLDYYENVFCFQLVLKEIITEMNEIKFKLNLLEFYNFFSKINDCIVVGIIPSTDEQQKEKQSDLLILNFINLLLYRQNELIGLNDLTKNYMKNKVRLEKGVKNKKMDKMGKTVKAEKVEKMCTHYYGIFIIEKLNYIINNNKNIYDENNNLINPHYLINIFPPSNIKLGPSSFICANMLFAYNYIYFKRENLLFASVDSYNILKKKKYGSMPYFGLKQHNYMPVNKENKSVNFMDYFYEYIYSSNIYYKNLLNINISREKRSRKKIDQHKLNEKKDTYIEETYHECTSNSKCTPKEDNIMDVVNKLRDAFNEEEGKYSPSTFNIYSVLKKLCNRLFNQHDQNVKNHVGFKNICTFENKDFQYEFDNSQDIYNHFSHEPYFFLHHINQTKTNECGNFNIQEVKNEREYTIYRIYTFLFYICDIVFYVQKTALSFHTTIDPFFEKFLKFLYRYNSNFSAKSTKTELHFVYNDEDTNEFFNKYSKFYHNKIRKKKKKKENGTLKKKKEKKNDSDEYIYKWSESDSTDKLMAKKDTYYYSEDCERILMNYVYTNYDMVEKEKMEKLKSIIENNIMEKIQKNKLFCYGSNIVTIVLNYNFESNNLYKYFDEDKKMRLEYFPFFKYNICKYQKKHRKDINNSKCSFCVKNNFTCSYCLKKKSTSLYAEIFNNIFYNEKYDVSNSNYIHPTFSVDLFQKRIYRLIYKKKKGAINYFVDYFSALSDIREEEKLSPDNCLTFNYSYSCDNTSFTNVKTNIDIFLGKMNHSNIVYPKNDTKKNSDKEVDEKKCTINSHRENKGNTTSMVDSKISSYLLNNSVKNNVSICYNSFFYQWIKEVNNFNVTINDLIIYISTYDILYKYNVLKNKKLDIQRCKCISCRFSNIVSVKCDNFCEYEQNKNTQIREIIPLNDITKSRRNSTQLLNKGDINTGIDDGRIHLELKTLNEENKNKLPELHVLNEKNLLIHNNKDKAPIQKDNISNQEGLYTPSNSKGAKNNCYGVNSREEDYKENKKISKEEKKINNYNNKFICPDNSISNKKDHINRNNEQVCSNDKKFESQVIRMQNYIDINLFSKTGNNHSCKKKNDLVKNEVKNNYHMFYKNNDYSSTIIEGIFYILLKCYVSLPKELKGHELVDNLLDLIEMFLLYLLNKGFHILHEQELFVNTIKSLHAYFLFSLNKTKDIITSYIINNDNVDLIINPCIFLFMKHLIREEKRMHNRKLDEYSLFKNLSGRKSNGINYAYLHQLESGKYEKGKDNNKDIEKDKNNDIEKDNEKEDEKDKKEENNYIKKREHIYREFSTPFEENFMYTFIMSALNLNYCENLKLLKKKSETVFSNVTVLAYNFKSIKMYKDFVNNELKTKYNNSIIFKLKNDFSLYLCKEDLCNIHNQKHNSYLFKNFINTFDNIQLYQLKDNPNIYLYVNVECECYQGCRYFKSINSTTNYFHKYNEKGSSTQGNKEHGKKIVDFKKDASFKIEQLNDLNLTGIDYFNISKGANAISQRGEKYVYVKNSSLNDNCNKDDVKKNKNATYNTTEFIGNKVLIHTLPVFDTCPAHVNNINQNENLNYFIKNTNAKLSRIWVYSPVIKNISFRTKICIPLPLTQLYKMKEKLENNEHFEFERFDVNEENFVYMYLSHGEILVPQHTLALLTFPLFFYVCSKKLLNEINNLLNQNGKTDTNYITQKNNLFCSKFEENFFFYHFYIDINIFDVSNSSQESESLVNAYASNHCKSTAHVHHTTVNKKDTKKKSTENNLTSSKGCNKQKYVILPFPYFYNCTNELNNYRISIDFTELEI
ncbi:hypothetical protein MKS88_002972 [Plasmodium brasilianum]|uniref:Uncharacterized protein n=1 Tax=Plasmodium brasilianum TaxID=5824 RepID=A0ACB9YB16_PLABR|nr:hypothetical protein MKS88_002972 [Plasmodium brasilianum]